MAGKRATIFLDGDSLTDNAAGWGAAGVFNSAYVLQQRLTSLGHNIVVRTAAIGGQNSMDKVSFIEKARYYGDPVMSILMIGVNDPGQSITSAGTQLDIELWLMAMKHGAMGYAIPMSDGTWANTSQGTEPTPPALYGTDGATVVAAETALPTAQASSGHSLTATGYVGQRFVVVADGATSGGATVPAGDERLLTPTVPGAGSGGVAVWERVNGQAGVNGWHRIAVPSTPPTFCKRNVVVSTQYLNWPTGGDSPATPYATYAPVRVAQQAAVTAENAPMTINGVANTSTVVYADLYNLMRNLIVSQSAPNFSPDTSIVPTVSYDFNRDWHASQNNQHLGDWGQDLIAQAIMNAAPPAWLSKPLGV